MVRRRALVRLVGLLVSMTLVAGLLSVLPSTSASAAASLTISPSKPIANETFSVSGKINTPVRRSVELQRRQGSRWVRWHRGSTDRRGAFTFRVATRNKVTVRVVAPAARVSGKRYPKITGSARTVTLAAQRVTMSLPGQLFRNQLITVGASAVPARTGRLITLQVRQGSGWRTVATAKETADGSARIRTAARSVGTFTYRLVVAAARGAATTTSSSKTIKIVPDKVKVGAAGRQLKSAELDDLASYRSGDGRLVFDADAPASVRSLKRGDILPLPAGTAGASGALRAVTGVTRRSDGTVAVTTKEAKLSSVIENVPDNADSFAPTSGSVKFVPAGGVDVQAQPQTSSRRATGLAADAPTLKFTFDSTVRKGNGYLSARGATSITPVIDFEYNMDWFRLTHYKLGAGVQVEQSVTSEMGFAAELKAPRIPLGQLEYRAVFLIGGWPVYVQVTMPIYLQVSATGKIAVTVTQSTVGRTTLGVTNKPGSLDPMIYTTKARTSSTMRDLSVAGSIAAFAGVEPAVYLYGLAGPFAKLGIDAELGASLGTGSGLRCRLTYGPHLEGGVKSSEALEKLTGLSMKVSAVLQLNLVDWNGCAAPDRLSIIEPGRLGPLRVGMKAYDPAARGLIIRDPDQICGARWKNTNALMSRSIFTEERDGDPDDIDEIAAVDYEPDTNPSTVTSWEGIRIGSTEAQLLDTYGSQLGYGSWVSEGGRYYSYILFTGHGALMFILDSSTANPRKVGAMIAVRGTSMADLDPAAFGC